ncbi:MAG: hypothetical protein CMJ81_15505, partial [Planctomycetaceae bacterium]|nr:hypothetical protein [Planctomycetaceae bacterium]
MANRSEDARRKQRIARRTPPGFRRPSLEYLEERVLLSLDTHDGWNGWDAAVDQALAAQLELAVANPLSLSGGTLAASDGAGAGEPLPPRTLLTDPFYTAGFDSTGFDLTLEIAGDELALLKAATGELVASANLSDIDGTIHIVGSGQDDVLHVNLETTFIIDALPHGILFEAGEGDDQLRGPSDNTTWNVTGQNLGNISSAGVFDFLDVETLLGNVDNEDTFVIAEGGGLSGLVSGGAGGFDSMVLDGGTFESVVYTATGPDSGTIVRDEDILTYAGLEPIVDNTPSTDRAIQTSNLTDHARLVDLGGQLRLESTDGIPTFESLTFVEPTNSLTINLGGDSAVPPLPIAPFSDTLQIQALSLDAELIVNGQGGRDEVTISGNMDLAGNPLSVNAEQITVNPGVTVTAGAINLNAVATLGTAITPDAFPVATVDAAVNINGADLVGSDILLTANTTLFSDVTNPLPTIPLASLVANVSAEVAVTGNSTISATGLFTADAVSTVNSIVLGNATAGLPVGEIGTAAPLVNNTALSHLSGNSSLAAGGAVTIDATTNTNINTTASGITATTATGTTVATPVINVTTEAFIDGTAEITQADTIDVNATANSTLTTT